MNNIANKQKGFSVVEVLVILLIFIGVCGIGYYVYITHNKVITSNSAPDTNNISDTSQWLPYTAVNKDFSAEFPTSPNFSKTPVSPSPVSKNINGVNVVLNSVLSSNNINTEYIILSLSYPSDVKLPNVKESFPSYQNVHVISSKSTIIDGKNAETYELTASRKPQIVYLQGRDSPVPATPIYDSGEFITDGNVLYELDSVHNGNTSAPNTQYFLNSFKLNN